MKKLLAVILCALLVLSLAACTNSGSEGSTSAADTTAAQTNEKATEAVETDAETESQTDAQTDAPAEEIELVWATFKTDWVDVLETKIFPEYEKDHPGITVSVYTAESGDLFGDLKTLLAAGNLPNIFNMRGDNFGYEYKDVLQDVSSSAAIANAGAGMTDGFSWDGGIYGAYFNYEIHGIIWNKAVLNEIGLTDVPTTKTEALDAMAKMYDAGHQGLMYLQTPQVLYNHIGNAPIVLGGNTKERYEGVVNGTIDPTTDQYWNELFDFLGDINQYLDPDSITYDQNIVAEKLFPEGSSGYGWMFCSGTTGAYYKYETNFTDEWSIGPFCIDDDNAYYIQNCQAYVVSNQGTDAENAAALDLYNWWYTSDFVAETLTNEFSVITATQSYTPSETQFDAYTYDALMKIKNGFSAHAITYYMGSDLCNNYGAIVQKYMDDALPDYGKEEALNEAGEIFRAQK